MSTIAKPGPHEVLIRTVACGVCRSDLHFVDGAYPTALPAIPGHEAAGIVEAVGDEVRTVKVGDAVVTCLSRLLRALRVLRHRAHVAVHLERHQARARMRRRGSA